MKYLGKDPIPSKASTDAYRDGWERIFGKKEEPCDLPPEPEKWHCTRAKGHEGPCAAVPRNEPRTPGWNARGWTPEDEGHG